MHNSGIVEHIRRCSIHDEWDRTWSRSEEQWSLSVKPNLRAVLVELSSPRLHCSHYITTYIILTLIYQHVQNTLAVSGASYSRSILTMFFVPRLSLSPSGGFRCVQEPPNLKRFPGNMVYMFESVWSQLDTTIISCYNDHHIIQILIDKWTMSTKYRPKRLDVVTNICSRCARRAPAAFSPSSSLSVRYVRKSLKITATLIQGMLTLVQEVTNPTSPGIYDRMRCSGDLPV